jgi:hypothetical protein
MRLARHRLWLLAWICGLRIAICDCVVPIACVVSSCLLAPSSLWPLVWSLQLGFVIGGANCICTLRFALMEFQLVFLVIYIVCVFLWPHTYLPLPNLGTPLQVGRWPVQVPGVPLLGGLGPWI